MHSEEAVNANVRRKLHPEVFSNLSMIRNETSTGWSTKKQINDLASNYKRQNQTEWEYPGVFHDHSSRLDESNNFENKENSQLYANRD